jgi:hypothetical protein
VSLASLPDEGGPINKSIDVYVFICANPAVRGLSLRQSPENLPKPEDGSDWLPVAVTTLTTEGIKRHAPDPNLAILNLRTKGYHVARVTAQMLSFRTQWSRRCSALPRVGAE